MIKQSRAFIFLIGIIIFSSILYFLFSFSSPPNIHNKNTLNIYTWIDFIPPVLQKKFEQQTGIKLHVDYIDSDEGLEAKLLTGKSEYDVVYPSTPYVFRHIQLNLYQPLNLKLIPNISNIDLEFIRDFKNGHTIYSIPYLWGSSGFAYNRDVIQSIFGEITIDSWAYMFDPVNLQKLKRKGIASTASGNELFCAIGLWQGYLPHHYTEDLIHIAAQYARLARPYWRVFLSSESAIQALGSGEVALAFIWNGDAVAAQNLGNIQGQTIQYVIPKEGALKWIDSLAIPYNAPHTEAAHTFINFLLDPQNMAEVTNYVQFANTSTHSKKFIKPEIINNPVLYPAAAYMQRLILDTRTDPKLERTINRQFFKILVGY